MSERLQVIVVGSGVAGMTYATQLMAHLGADAVRIRILCKAPVQVSSSFSAQGGIAAVMRTDDTFEQHVRDTLLTGAGRNDPEVVGVVVREGPALIRSLIGYGARFDRDEDGTLSMAREGGHSAPRVVHHQDRTGEEIVRVLQDRVLRDPGIEMVEGQRVLDLLLDGEGPDARAIGVRSIDPRLGGIIDRYAHVIVLATGGAGRLYATTTNPISATGDGVAMAARAGAVLRDMAFVQFHPTALDAGAEEQAFLISEAVRGAGARLLKEDRSSLMEGIHAMGDLAPRHVVARAIHQELVRTGAAHVWLDPTPIGAARFAALFPAIAVHCRALGHRPGIDLLPVRPAAHFMIGGVRTDAQGNSSIPGLLALGECASSGMHGADRLASNSLLEALVIADRAAAATAQLCAAEACPEDIHAPGDRRVEVDPWAEERLGELRTMMTREVGIVRTMEGLQRAQQWVGSVAESINERWTRYPGSLPLVDLRDMQVVAAAIIDGAIMEPQNMGTHYREGTEELKANMRTVEPIPTVPVGTLVHPRMMGVSPVSQPGYDLAWQALNTPFNRDE